MDLLSSIELKLRSLANKPSGSLTVEDLHELAQLIEILYEQGDLDNPHTLAGIFNQALRSGKLHPVSEKHLEQKPRWKQLIDEFFALRNFVIDLSHGYISGHLEARGDLANRLKALQASLRRLTWQVEQVTKGDLTQKIEFLGEFSTAFNAMTESLTEARKSLAESEQKHRLLAENIRDVIWTMNLDGVVTYMSPSVLELCGYTPEETQGQTLEQWLSEESAALTRQKLKEIRPSLKARRRYSGGNYAMEILARDGRRIPVETTLSGLYDDQDEFVGFLGVTRDITERLQAEQAIIDQRRLAEALRDTASELNSALSIDQVFDVIHRHVARVAPFDLVELLLVHPNQVAQVVRYAYRPESALSQCDRLLWIQMDQSTNLSRVGRELAPAIVENITQDPWYGLPENHWIGDHLDAPILTRGELAGFISLSTQAAHIYTPTHAENTLSLANQAAIAIEKVQLFDRLNWLATTDELTRVSNRRHFFELAGLEFERSTRYQSPLTVALLDMDYFKQINDTHGHINGDRALQWICQLMKTSLRKVDLIGRYGGEEFSFAMPETDVAQAKAALERLRVDVSRFPITSENGAFHCTVSIGICQRTTEESLQELFSHADQALYAAKQAGRNRTMIYNEI